MLDLSLAASQNGATLEGVGPIAVTTIAAQWSYAAAFPLDPAGANIIRVRGKVLRGRIGVMIVAEDMTTILSNEPSLEQGWDGEVEIHYLKKMAGFLVVRNHDVSESKLEMHAVELDLKERPSSPLAPWADPQLARKRPSRELFEILRKKWSEVPAGLMGRRRTPELAKISDEELLSYWRSIHAEASTGDGYKVRGWFHHIYSEMLRGKKVMDVGSGLGIDGLTLAMAGARMTFVDIAAENLEVLKRLCPLLGITGAKFHHVVDLDSLDALPCDFDAIWCQGSMINAPFEFMAVESQKLLEHLPVGGRWIELCYPYERWLREGEMPFSEWGAVTDGEGTPWMEWYDLERLQARMKPADFKPLLAFNFHNDDFNWFDLLRSA